MSHFVKISTKLSNRDYLKKALERMKIQYTEGNFTISKYGKNETAQLQLDENVGLQLQNDGTYSMVGDFYYSKSNTLRKYYNHNDLFNKDLTTAYAIEETKRELESQYFYCCENEEGTVDEDGIITMVYEKWE